MLETGSLIMSSVCVNAAAITVMTGHFYGEDKKEMQTCSKDLMILMFIGTLLRAYWSHSPPEVWSDEDIFVQLFGQIDSVMSPLVWITLIFTVGQAQVAEPAYRPIWAKWWFLSAIASFIGIMCPVIFSYHELPEEAFPFTIPTAISNLLIEVSAMIPQILLNAYGWEKISTQSNTKSVVSNGSQSVSLSPYTTVAVVQSRWAASTTPHFVGFLSLGRVFRAIFWLATVKSLWNDDASGDWALVLTLVLPDVLHSVLLGDFLVRWLRQFKEQTVDPWVHQVSLTL